MSDGVLFPVPTIAATLPAVAKLTPATAKNIAVYTIGEDEWRQEEFLSLSWQPTIAKELSAIRAIPPDNGEQTSYPRMHLRKLSGLWGVRLEQIQQSLQIPNDSWRRLAFAETAGVVANSFALPFGQSLLYGQQKGGVTEALCLQRRYFPTADPADIQLLARLADISQCCLVDWCRAVMLMPFTDDFKEHFR